MFDKSKLIRTLKIQHSKIEEINKKYPLFFLLEANVKRKMKRC